MFILFTGYCWNGTSYPREKLLCLKLSTLKIRSLKKKIVPSILDSHRSFDSSYISLIFERVSSRWNIILLSYLIISKKEEIRFWTHRPEGIHGNPRSIIFARNRKYRNYEESISWHTWIVVFITHIIVPIIVVNSDDYKLFAS